jgi:hypothetical protein
MLYIYLDLKVTECKFAEKCVNHQCKNDGFLASVKRKQHGPDKMMVKYSLSLGTN